MAYREVRGMDIDQVIRRWMAGERIRAIARATGTDRNTVRRIVRFKCVMVGLAGVDPAARVIIVRIVDATGTH